MHIQRLVFISLCTLLITGCTSTKISHNSNNIRPLEMNQCVNGTTRQGFISPTTSADASCAQGTQTCQSGQWQGQELFYTCDNYTKSCGIHPHGSTINGYLQPQGTPCVAALKTCLNGSWSGPEVYPSCSEL
jgi:hypothetical protein